MAAAAASAVEIDPLLTFRAALPSSLSLSLSLGPKEESSGGVIVLVVLPPSSFKDDEGRTIVPPPRASRSVLFPGAVSLSGE